MKFVKLANKMLREGKGTQDWTRGTRWQDFVLAMQWLHDRRSSREDRELLHDTTIRIKSVSTDWRSVFSEERFPKEAVTEWRIYWHGKSSRWSGRLRTLNDPWAYSGVNLAEGLKAMAVGYRFSKDKSGS
jgi:hypothetical protein